MEKEKLFFTDNVKIAAALMSAGFACHHIERILDNGREKFAFELDSEAHGIKAHDFAAGFENKWDLPGRVDEIVAQYGISEADYATLAFDAARAGLHNRSALMVAGHSRKELIAKSISGGRTLVYRAGMDKDELRKLVNS